VSSRLQGRMQNLLVAQGDAVKKGQLLAVIEPDEYKADKIYYQQSEQETAAYLEQAKSDLDVFENQSREQIRRAEAELAKDKAHVSQANAELEYALVSFNRVRVLLASKTISQQDYDQSRTAYASAKAQVLALQGAVKEAEAALALARANGEQIAARRAAVIAGIRHLAAAGARTAKSDLLLGYTRILAPVDGRVDVLAALPGEVVNFGQTIVTLVDPGQLWIRADVEESYIDRIHLGDIMEVRLPSGASRPGTVFFRGVDADYATQRDVSRSKRDIKTFELRLRCDNRDCSLALGMTAYVMLPVGPKS